MAQITITLVNKDGTSGEVVIKNMGKHLPELIISKEKHYILRRITERKTQAFYNEAVEIAEI